MASGIAVTPERLRDVSAEVGAGAADVEAIMSRLADVVASVRAEWDGAAQTQFDALWDRWQKDATGVHSVLAGLAKLTQNAAVAYEAIDQSIATSFTEFQVDPDMIHTLAAGALGETFEALPQGRLGLADTGDARLSQTVVQLVEQSQGEMEEEFERFSQIEAILQAPASEPETVESRVVTAIEGNPIEEAGQPLDRQEVSPGPPWALFPKATASDSETVESHVVTAIEGNPIEEASQPLDQPKASTRRPWARFMTRANHDSETVERDVVTAIEEEVNEDDRLGPARESGMLRREPPETQGIRLVEPRPLTPAEKGIMDALLTPGFPGVEELRAQVPYARVAVECDCGCPSIDLVVSPDAPLSSVKTHNHLAPVKAWVTPVASERFGKIILCVENGSMTTLEYVFYDYPSPSGWPSLDRLAVERTDSSVSAGDSRV